MSTQEVDDFIEHFGVLGMKWGVRNDKSHKSIRTANAEARTARRAASGKVALGTTSRQTADKPARPKGIAAKRAASQAATTKHYLDRAEGNKSKAVWSKIGVGLAATGFMSLAGTTVAGLLTLANPLVGAGALGVSGLLQSGILAQTAIDAINIKNSD